MTPRYPHTLPVYYTANTNDPYVETSDMPRIILDMGEVGTSNTLFTNIGGLFAGDTSGTSPFSTSSVLIKKSSDGKTITFTGT
jgi:hypothetical protein